MSPIIGPVYGDWVVHASWRVMVGLRAVGEALKPWRSSLAMVVNIDGDQR
jgi:hypothetical protein